MGRKSLDLSRLAHYDNLDEKGGERDAMQRESVWNLPELR